MGLTMKNILKQFSDSNKFSLTGKISKYNITIPEEELEKEIEKIDFKDRQKYFEKFIENYNVTELEFLNALAKITEEEKEEKRKHYEKIKKNHIDYPDFETLYETIKQECYNFCSEENKEIYLKKYYTEEEIAELDDKFFQCRLIAGEVGNTTKYGKENKEFFWHLYHIVGLSIDRENQKGKYCIKHGKNPIEQIPEELKKNFLYYEISFSNTVTTSSGLMINYYFKLNDETKKYLLRYRNDFCLEPLEDLTIYKNDEVKFYSCTHEEFNSLEINYKNMTTEEIADFINDKFYKEDNSVIIETINKLIKMPNNRQFSFGELNINDSTQIYTIHNICRDIELNIIYEEQQDIIYWKQPSKEGFYEEIPKELIEIYNSQRKFIKTK